MLEAFLVWGWAWMLVGIALPWILKYGAELAVEIVDSTFD